jgi:ketosteroid isomerase-like protein
MTPSRSPRLLAVDDPLVERTRQIFEYFSRRDATAMLELCDPAVEFFPVTAAMVADGRPYVGHEGIRRYLADAARIWEQLLVEPSEFHRAGDDTVVVAGRVYAWGVGRVIDAPVGWVWRFSPAGLAVYGRVYDSRGAALEAGGIDVA